MVKSTDNRSYNEQLQDTGDMPRIVIKGTPEKIEKSGGSRVLIAPPLAYDEIMKRVPYGKVITSDHIKHYLAVKHDADYTCPVSSRKFIVLAAEASVERGVDETPYWRTLKKDGELNEKYPDGIEKQKLFLEKEGHTIIQEGKKYFVKDYSDKLFEC
jgi:alkylated DNA nucleotide flippase Atl1